MEFLSTVYALFLLSFLGVYWTIGKSRWRLWVILAASLVFYASLQVQYIPLLLASIFINFRLGRVLNAVETQSKRKGKITKTEENSDLLVAQNSWNPRRFSVLWLGIAINVLLLLGFKYVPFVLESFDIAFNWPQAGTGADWFRVHVLAPLGLSFFSFECIAYLIDVYRGAPASNSLLEFSAYKFFFPKLISGPITGYHHWVTQFKALKFPSSENVTEGLWLIACGAVKKGLLADPLRIVVDVILNTENLQRAGSVDLWLAIVAYSLQLYLDFSGYVDIARGSALLMGVNLPQNFDFPYLSTSIADFWRRWHITLGDWLRNYLYFPLGGSRQGLNRTCLNLLIVMLIAGIWHGAAWGYIIWGCLHGIALVIHRLNHAISERWGLLKGWWQSLPGIIMAWFITQSMVFTAWIWFRLPDVKYSTWVVQHLWGYEADAQFFQKVYTETVGLNRFELSGIMVVLMAAMSFAYFIHRGLKVELTWPVKILLVPLCFFTVWLLAPNGTLPFIYFDF
jgi:alginate O-acetyltransferase complex protein AlgI